MRKVLVLLAAALICPALCLVNCSSDDNNPTGDTEAPDTTTVSIGPDGGAIAVGTTVTLTVPAGAVADTVDFTIVENSSPASAGDTVHFVTKVYSIGPSGTSFSTPCEIRLQYSEAAIQEAAESELVIATCSGGSWSFLTTTVDTAVNAASAEISHLSDFSVTEYIRKPATGDLAAMLRASILPLGFDISFRDNMFWLLQYIDKRYPLRDNMTYNKTTGQFRIHLGGEVTGDWLYTVKGGFLGAPVTYHERCVRTIDTLIDDVLTTVCVDTILFPDTTLAPPAYIVDGLHQNEVALFWWQVYTYGSDTDLRGLGTYSLHMLSHDAYTMSIVQENRFWYTDTSVFKIDMLSYNWDLSLYFEDYSHWSFDHSVFIWPTGFTEYVFKMDGDPDSLNVSISYGNNITTGNIRAIYGQDTADATIDWETYLLSD